MYDARSRYVAASVETASPARLLTMLCDRLLLDVQRAAHALGAGQRPQATQHLAHAQEIVAELIASLDVDAWEGGPRLLSIYTWLHGELLSAAASGDAERVDACARVVEPLARTWHEAADAVARTAAPAVPAPVAAYAATAAPGAGLLGVG
ncbi:flagellar export chaperone FliS [Cellulomonas telluris]|uniref:flagellar export chaperone FliS n=1 Tax=Cellulomonas telluris TaxID=2306636 RepID=UPI0010A813BC|nr:flagellar export chaperone FliS [Cellulomonas telluris]